MAGCLFTSPVTGEGGGGGGGLLGVFGCHGDQPGWTEDTTAGG